MTNDIPAISGPELIKLLIKDGWTIVRRANHGCTLKKTFKNERTRVTLVPTKKRSLPTGTLMAILGKKQTQIGREGLLKLLQKK